MKASATTLDPKILGFWTRCMRETAHISQEALAAASGLDARTIQRIEVGQAVSLTTRRCLARGLEYENKDTFDDPEFIANVTSLLQGITDAQLEKAYPDCIRLKAARVVSGDALGRFAETANAMMLQADDEISLEAKGTAAAIFDFVRDLLDLGNEALFADKLSYNESLESLRKDLEEQGAILYSAFRPVKVCGEDWPSRSPLSFMVGYLAALPSDRDLNELMVPKRCQFG